MSLILKGIDLPEKGMKVICLFPNGAEELVVLDSGATAGRPVQAIQIPKGHGRLIDADKLRKEFSRTESGYCGYWEFCDKPEDMQFLIDDEPTILESEEDDESNTGRD